MFVSLCSYLLPLCGVSVLLLLLNRRYRGRCHNMAPHQAGRGGLYRRYRGITIWLLINPGGGVCIALFVSNLLYLFLSPFLTVLLFIFISLHLHIQQEVHCTYHPFPPLLYPSQSSIQPQTWCRLMSAPSSFATGKKAKEDPSLPVSGTPIPLFHGPNPLFPLRQHC